MKHNPYLSVVIPAYNEEKRLPKTLESVIRYLENKSYLWEVAIVNDGSTDNTSQVVLDAGIQDQRIRLLEYRENRGKGFAVRYGMTHTAGALRLFMDADNSTSIDHIEQLLPLFKKGFDVVIGSRDVPGSTITIHQPKWKEICGRLGNLWIQMWLLPGMKDTQAGFKIFTAAAAEAVFSRITIDRWGFDIEALSVARKLGYAIAERPIRWRNDPDSRVPTGAYFDVLKEVLRVRVNIWKDVYNLKEWKEDKT